MGVHGNLRQYHHRAVMFTVTVSVCHAPNCVAAVSCQMQLLYANLACIGVVAFCNLAVMDCLSSTCCGPGLSLEAEAALALGKVLKGDTPVPQVSVAFEHLR